MRMEPIDYVADLGCLGNRPALIVYETSVSWARHPSEGFDDVRVHIVSLEILMPGIDPDTLEWNDELYALDVTPILTGPKGALLKQRIESELEEKYHEKILEKHRTAHMPDRWEDVI